MTFKIVFAILLTAMCVTAIWLNVLPLMIIATVILGLDLLSEIAKVVKDDS